MALPVLLGSGYVAAKKDCDSTLRNLSRTSTHCTWLISKKVEDTTEANADCIFLVGERLDQMTKSSRWGRRIAPGDWVASSGRVKGLFP